MLRVLPLVVLVSVAGCTNDDFEPPGRTAVVVAEESRVAALIERHESGVWEDRSGRCAVRILGIEADSTFAWAQCSYPPLGDVPAGAMSTAYRIDGQSIRSPRDGSYSEDIEALFPAAVAEAIAKDSQLFLAEPWPIP